MNRIWLAALVLGLPMFAGGEARLFRFPDVSQDHITFVYAGDIWIVSKSGGLATRLSTPAGEESFPRFSPDGKTIAFTGNYDGNSDIYLLPTAGGIPQRLTHHPMGDRVLDWHPNGQSVLFASSMASGKQRFNQLYLAPVNGGMPQKLDLPYGEFGSFSADGETLAYMPVSRDFRTWKRYRGGSTTDIWLYNLKSHASKNITTTDSNDSQPMWHGATLYFLSDRDENKRSNIWSYNTQSGETKQLTFYKEFDIHFPAIGPNEIVYENGGNLYLLDLASGQSKQVNVSVQIDQANLKPRRISAAENITSGDISPSGNRVVIEARGELFSAPKENGVTLNLTQTSGVAERFPVWSPDGKDIAYFSDQSGEYELTIRPANGKGDAKTVTQLGPGFRYNPTWSPDSKKIVFIDQAMKIHVFNRSTGATQQIDQMMYQFHGGLSNFSFSWSPDSRWVAYQMDQELGNAAIALYDTQTQKKHQVTAGFNGDFNPSFDPDGKYLYFATNRHFQPAYSDFDNSFIYPNSTQLAVITLKADEASPIAPKNDVEEAKAEEPKKDEAKKGKKDKDEKAEDEKPKVTAIDLANMEGRMALLPPEPGNLGQLHAVSGKLLYVRRPNTGSAEKDAVLQFYDLEEREEKTIFSGLDGYAVSADGKKVLVLAKGKLAVLDIAPEQKLEKTVPTDGLVLDLDPMAEWQQIFTDAWRLERDFFYDPNMHGVNWNTMRERYGALIPYCASRFDVNFVIGELIAELNCSHTYRGGGDQENGKRMNVGLLGADFSLENGAFKIAKIIKAAPWDSEVRSALDAAGLKVKEGDFLIAVNGQKLDPAKDIWAAFQGLAGQTVALTLSATADGKAPWDILVEPMDINQDTRLRNLAWIESNRQKVDKATNGKVGYIFVPSTGIDGQDELVRMFYGQYGKDGLIIDERFNNGGQIPDRFVELLNRPIRNFWGVRDGKDWQWPPVAHAGAKVMLINEWSGSGGDCFPYYFRQSGLGPLIGTTTWGGLIGISGAPGLIDGGGVTVPTFSIYAPEGQWVVENQGVKPDIEVEDDPALMWNGGDPQLERAIEEVQKQLAAHPPVRGKKPAYPNRSGY
ncbi:MAG: PD40 domain-containing protein [Acidobacteria bacterium]|nr:PD40 domain-containing protein [Acidobacteriota bacterium]MCB9397826.1 PD40 domain-containing protein [Acidobacteriota bacterium]